VVYADESQYREFVKEKVLVANELPGERARANAKILEIKLNNQFNEALRLSAGFFNSGQFNKALQQAEEAIRIKPNIYNGYYAGGGLSWALKIITMPGHV